MKVSPDLAAIIGKEEADRSQCIKLNDSKCQIEDNNKKCCLQIIGAGVKLIWHLLHFIIVILLLLTPIFGYGIINYWYATHDYFIIITLFGLVATSAVYIFMFYIYLLLKRKCTDVRSDDV